MTDTDASLFVSPPFRPTAQIAPKSATASAYDEFVGASYDESPQPPKQRPAQTPSTPSMISTDIPLVQLTERFEPLGAPLASGAFGHVFRAIDKQRRNRAVALKLLHRVNDESRQEIKLLQQLSATACHPNVVCYVDFFRTVWNSKWYVVIETEFIDGRDLTVLQWKQSNVAHAPTDVACRIARGCLKGLAFLHANKVCHLDIKPANIVLRRSGEPVIVDLGLACFDESGCAIAKGGTIKYLSRGRHRCSAARAELCSFHEKAAADVWALGLTFVDAFTRRGNALRDQLEITLPDLTIPDADIEQQIRAFGDFYPPDGSISAVIDSMLQNVDDKRRPSAAALLSRLTCRVARPAIEPAVREKLRELGSKLQFRVLREAGLE